MPRITIELRDAERIALQKLARRKRRDSRAQAAELVRERLLELGMFSEDGEGLYETKALIAKELG